MVLAKKHDRFVIPSCSKGKKVGKFGKFKGYYGSTFTYSASSIRKFKLYMVRSESVSIREETYASSASIGSLVSGQYIIGSSESQNWVQFGEGYVDTSSLVEVQGTSGYYVTSDIISRTGPSISYSEVASVEQGTEITYYGEDPNDSNWCITDAGYIEKKYLSITSETSSYVSSNTSAATSAYSESSAYSSSLAYISSSAFKTSEMLCKKQNYGQQRNINSIKYIVIHSASSYEQSSSSYGYSAQYSASYYQKYSKKESFHYFIDGSHVISSVPDNYVAWPIGTSHWKSSSISNSNTLNIVLCNEQSSATSVSSTMNMTVKVVKEMMKKYHISYENVILASDVCQSVTKKSWMKKSVWESFKSRIIQY